MQNVTEMRAQLAEVFADLRAGKIEPKIVTELNNAAGKIINSCRIQLEYQTMTKEKPSIAFLDGL